MENLTEQLSFFPETPSSVKLGIHGTFLPNHSVAVHRWYPYIEGFSSGFVSSLIDEFGSSSSILYDPFAGTGTTVQVACTRGLRSYYSEINPFMRMVVEAKTNGLRTVVRKHKELRNYFAQILKMVMEEPVSAQKAKSVQADVFGKRKFFTGSRLVEVLSIKHAIETITPDRKEFRNLALVTLGAIAVSSSEMIRRADLRRRKGKELLPPTFSAIELFERKLHTVLEDVKRASINSQKTNHLSNSALTPPVASGIVNLIVTSPPYLNGTNYFRNTKLELWLTGFIENEKDLSDFRTAAVAAGINNITKKGRKPERIASVERITQALDKEAYDKRIPELVRRYFSDTAIWLKHCFQLLGDSGRLVVDIGDSIFAGVHVPTDELLSEIGLDKGFELAEIRKVRDRRSNDGSPLTQVLIILEKRRKLGLRHSAPSFASSDRLKAAAIEFEADLPYKREPFSARNWGCRLHSLCSYQGKLKPAIAHFLVDRFTRPGETILDPLSGAGTIPLEASLQGRVALGNDLQELGYILTRAKIDKGQEEATLSELDKFLSYIDSKAKAQDSSAYSDFGFNGKIPEYFDPRTYQEILAGREFMLSNPCESWGRAVVYACFLHILHGNRPYALSRRSHPVTPFKPQGEFKYRPVRPRLINKVNRTLKARRVGNPAPAAATLGDYRALPYTNDIDAVITSPPFAASTRFYMANWLRLWLSGWEPEDFTTKPAEFLEDKQKKSIGVYAEFFSHCDRWLRSQGLVIMHLGRTKTINMAEKLSALSAPLFETVYICEESVVGNEKFGIRDQGATLSHQFLFLRRKQ